MPDNVYESCDRAIKIMNRISVREFGKLKLADFDELTVVRTIKRMYRKLAKRAEHEYLDVAYDAYFFALMMCELDEQKAEQMADKAITKEFVEDILHQTDFVTLYRFDSETERKAERLIEAVSLVEKADDRGDPIRNLKYNRNDQIDNALRQWSKQTGQYAINVTDYAILKAFRDAGVEEAEWVTESDQKVCAYCHSMSGKRYKLDDFPSKPHMNCRCTAKPILKRE